MTAVQAKKGMVKTLANSMMRILFSYYSFFINSLKLARPASIFSMISNARLESQEHRLNILETSQSINLTLRKEIRYNLKRYFVDQKLTYIELE